MQQATTNNSRTSRLYKALIVIVILVSINIALHAVFAHFIQDGGVSAISHRGAAAIAPENTLAGVRAGVASGAPFIEIDVRVSEDGVLVLMHDSTVDRTTDGSGKVGGLTLDYLSTLDAGGWFGKEFSNEPVPRLDSVLEYMKGKSSKLVIEVKSPGRYPEVETLLSEALRQYGMENDVLLISFDAGWIERAAGLMLGAELGVLYVYPFAVPPASEVEYASVFWPSLVLDPTLVWRMKKKGLKVWAWNVDSSILVKFLVWKGVDGLILDRAELVGED